jgi:hypothetical protein
MKKLMAVLAVGGLMTFGAMEVAEAQEQDGLVNVMVGDITILEDVRVAVAANVVAQICGLNVGPVVLLGRAVDRSGDTNTVCTVDTAPIRITQN